MATSEQFNLAFTAEVFMRLNDEPRRPLQVLAFGYTALDGYQLAVARGTINTGQRVGFLVTVADFDPLTKTVHKRIIGIDDYACEYSRDSTKLHLSGSRNDTNGDLVELVLQPDRQSRDTYYNGQLLKPVEYAHDFSPRRRPNKHYSLPGSRTEGAIDQDS